MPAQKYKADRSGRRKIQNLYGGLCIYISDKAGQDRRKPGGTEGKGCCTYRRNKMEDRNSISVYQRSCYGRRYGSSVDHVDFSVQVWKQIHEDQKKYFEDQEIVGWFFSQPRISMEATELLEKVHLKHFGGEKVLMLMEPQESEDAFFRYENNTMIRLEGYYLYYEKNTCMQNYMVEKNEKLQSDLTEKYEDKAVKDFRKIITEKTKEEKKKIQFRFFPMQCLCVWQLLC